MKDIFITGTFRNDWNKEFNLKLCAALEAKGLTVYLPQRDSAQSGDNKKTFEDDIAGIDGAKMILAIGSKTQTANWGFEIGYCFKSGKPVLILTDKEYPVELMPNGAASKVMTLDSLDETEKYMEDLVNEIQNLLKK